MDIKRPNGIPVVQGLEATVTGQLKRVVLNDPFVATTVRHMQLAESVRTGPIIDELNSKSALETVSEDVLERNGNEVPPPPPEPGL